MSSLESGVSLVTDLAKQIELDHQLGTIDPWPLPLKFRLAFDNSSDFYLARNPDGSFPTTPGYTNGVKHPDPTLTSYPSELLDPTTAAKASLINQSLTYTAKALDSSGNVITIELIDPSAVSTPLSVVVTGNAIVVTLETDVAGVIVSTADQVLALLNADSLVFALIVVTGSGAIALVAMASTNLAGGIDASIFESNLFYVLRDPSNLNRLLIKIKKKENEFNINAQANVITIYDDLGNLYAIAHVRELQFYAGESISFTIAVEAVTASTLDLVNLGDTERLIVADTRIINIANDTVELQRQVGYFAHDYRLGTQAQINTGEATNLIVDLPTLPADSKALILAGTHILTASMVMANNIHVDCDKTAILDLANSYTLTFQAKVKGSFKVINDAVDSVIFQGETWAKIDATAVATVKHEGVGAVLVNGEAQLSTSKTKDIKIINTLASAIGQLIDDGSGNFDIKSLVANALINFKNDSDVDMLTLDNASKKASFKGDVEILGSLLFTGTATVISPQIVTTADNIIVLNKGEVGAGVTKASGSSGNTIDRGTLPPFFLGFDEARDAMVIGEIINLINETSAEISACQVISTRENTPVDQASIYWDTASKMFKTDVTSSATRTRYDVYSTTEVDNAIITARKSWEPPVLSILSTPSGSPITGDRHIVGASATGVWVGKEDQIAEWNGATWDYTIPNASTVIFDISQNRAYRYTSSWVYFEFAGWDHIIGIEADVKIDRTANVWWNSASERFEDSANAIVSFVVGNQIVFITSYTHNAAYDFSQADLHIEALPGVNILSDTAILNFTGVNISVLGLGFTKSGAGTIVFNSATGRFVGIKAATGVVTVTAAAFCEQSVDGISVGSIVDSTSPTTGSGKFAGGLGIAKALWVGGLSNIAGALTVIGNITGAIGTFSKAVIDNITIDANTISSTDLNGDINLDPDGTGIVKIISGDLNLQAGNLIMANGKGIDFNAVQGTVGNPDPNAILDDYEEGTWVPTNANGLNDTTKVGHYTKIGNYVVATGYVQNNNAGTTANLFGGLPFTNHAGTNFEGIGIVGYQQETAGETWGITTIGNTSTFTFYVASVKKTLSSTNGAFFVIHYFTT